MNLDYPPSPIPFHFLCFIFIIIDKCLLRERDRQTERAVEESVFVYLMIMMMMMHSSWKAQVFLQNKNSVSQCASYHSPFMHSYTRWHTQS